MTTDTEARKIASEWHGGGGTALYAFASSGAIDTARSDHDIRAEIADCLTNYIPSDSHDPEAVKDELRQLLAYVQLADGPRGPVDGWAKLTW